MTNEYRYTADNPWVAEDGMRVWRDKHGDFLYVRPGLPEFALSNWLGTAIAAFVAAEQAPPDEPTGIGAVVRAGEYLFVRVNNGDHPWEGSDAAFDAGAYCWDYIKECGPVRVLNPGVNLDEVTE